MTNQLFLTLVLELFLPLLPFQLLTFYTLHLRHQRYQELGLNARALDKAQHKELIQTDQVLQRVRLLSIVLPFAFVLMSVLLLIRFSNEHGDKFRQDAELVQLFLATKEVAYA
jgi:hypothetical protein